jgi:hypothetical protein
MALLDEAAQRRVERSGLVEEANLYLFLLWYTTGGMMRGFSLQDLMNAPASLVQDFLYCLGRLGTLRHQREHAAEVRKQVESQRKKK